MQRTDITSSITVSYSSWVLHEGPKTCSKLHIISSSQCKRTSEIRYKLLHSKRLPLMIAAFLPEISVREFLHVCFSAIPSLCQLYAVLTASPKKHVSHQAIAAVMLGLNHVSHPHRNLQCSVISISAQEKEQRTTMFLFVAIVLAKNKPQTNHSAAAAAQTNK